MRRLSRLLITFAVIVPLSVTESARAFIIWPSDVDWIQLNLTESSGDFIASRAFPRRDLINYTAQNPAYQGFAYAADPTQNLAFFSMGLVTAPTLQSTNGVWQVLLDSNNDNLTDWTVQLDQKSNNRVALASVSSPAGGKVRNPNGLEVSTTNVPWFGVIGDYAQVRSGMSGNYLDLAVPLTSLRDNVGESFRISFSTSTNQNNINLDIIGTVDDSNTPGFWSGTQDAPEAVPEASTFFLLGMVTIAIGIVAVRRRRNVRLKVKRAASA